MSLQDDLVRWEAGDLSREDLLASCVSAERNLAEPWERNLDKKSRAEPEQEPRAEPPTRNLERNLEPAVDEAAMQVALAAMLDLHEQLSAIGEEPVPYHESDWEQLKASLPDRITQRRMFGTGRITRPLIAATMAVGLTAGAAAASPAVRERMVSVWQGIQRIALVGDPSAEQRRPSITPPIVPGAQAGGGANDDAGNSDGTPGGGNSGSPGNSDGTPGGGNSGQSAATPTAHPAAATPASPGNSDGTPGGGNTGGSGQLRRHARWRQLRQPGQLRRHTRRRQLGRSRQLRRHTRWRQLGRLRELRRHTGGGNSGGPGNSDGTPGGGNSGAGSRRQLRWR